MSEQEIFEQALAIGDAAERARFLAEACGEDRELRERIERELNRGFYEPPESKSEAGTAAFTRSADATAPTAEELATRFPQLEVLELLGRGGMGAVYKARQIGLDRLVALKILPPDIGPHPAFEDRFAREAKALARLNHPHIVTLYDFGLQGDLYYFLMEFVDGVNLRELMDSRQVSPGQALRIVPQICEALQYAHDEGIVHRDIKPENILLDRRGRIKIADFGLAKLVGSDPSGTRLTVTRQVMGTPRYMAPEQLAAAPDIDHRADIFSLGVVFYELLTGQLPIGKFDPPSAKVEIDVRLDDVVLRALESNRERRYQHAQDVKTDVDNIAADAPASSSRGSDGPAEDARGISVRARTLKGIFWLLAGLNVISYMLFANAGAPAHYWTVTALLSLTVFFFVGYRWDVAYPGREDERRSRPAFLRRLAGTPDGWSVLACVVGIVGGFPWVVYQSTSYVNRPPGSTLPTGPTNDFLLMAFGISSLTIGGAYLLMSLSTTLVPRLPIWLVFLLGFLVTIAGLAGLFELDSLGFTFVHLCGPFSLTVAGLGLMFASFVRERRDLIKHTHWLKQEPPLQSDSPRAQKTVMRTPTTGDPAPKTKALFGSLLLINLAMAILVPAIHRTAGRFSILSAVWMVSIGLYWAALTYWGVNAYPGREQGQDCQRPLLERMRTSHEGRLAILGLLGSLMLLPNSWNSIAFFFRWTNFLTLLSPVFVFAFLTVTFGGLFSLSSFSSTLVPRTPRWLALAMGGAAVAAGLAALIGLGPGFSILSVSLRIVPERLLLAAILLVIGICLLRTGIDMTRQGMPPTDYTGR